MAVKTAPAAQLSFADSFWTGRFQAMACPCEILIDTKDRAFAEAQCDAAMREAERIEDQFSRYRKGNIVDRINQSRGASIDVDDETAGLLDYAAQCYELSDGLFDITTGILRQVWSFNREENRLDTIRLKELQTRIGWDHVEWKRPRLKLPAGFEIDFGGIGKEYAADKILALLMKGSSVSTLVNLGGDIAVSGERLWTVGIESPMRPGDIARTLQLRQGALATSGVTKRFIKRGGEIFGHILNPKTGWPVKHAPLSVTVAACTCTEAGFLSTLAILQGEGAEAFLKEHASESWCYR